MPLGELVANVAEDAEFEAQERHCHVHTTIPEGDWGVQGNNSLLHSAVENVVRNAIRYPRKVHQVEIALRRGTGRWVGGSSQSERFRAGSSGGFADQTV